MQLYPVSLSKNPNIQSEPPSETRMKTKCWADKDGDRGADGTLCFTKELFMNGP